MRRITVTLCTLLACGPGDKDSATDDSSTGHTAASTTGVMTFSQSGRKTSPSRCRGPYCPGPSKARTL